MTVHARDWLDDQSIGRTAKWLWNRGYQFDYVSDRGLASARANDGLVEVPGGSYRVVVVPRCAHMPLQTLSNLVGLANSGAVIILDPKLPEDVPGFGDLHHRRQELKALLANAAARLLVGDLETELNTARIARETLFDHPGLMCIRRATKDGRAYFIANRGEQPFDGWLELASTAESVMVKSPNPVRELAPTAESVVILDPMTGATGLAAMRLEKSGSVSVRLQLGAGQSILLRVLAASEVAARWTYWKDAGTPFPLSGTWQVRFLEGGPERPASYSTDHLSSWTAASDTNAQRFAGAALYTLHFDTPPARNEHWRLDLGNVCQSARVRLNGTDCGTLFTPPFETIVGGLKPTANVLEVEVANVSANRIRDLDRRGVQWKNYHDINFVNIDYRPFDASNWPLTDSGLLGPVTLTPLVDAGAPAGRP